MGHSYRHTYYLRNPQIPIRMMMMMSTSNLMVLNYPALLVEDLIQEDKNLVIPEEIIMDPSYLPNHVLDPKNLKCLLHTVQLVHRFLVQVMELKMNLPQKMMTLSVQCFPKQVVLFHKQKRKEKKLQYKECKIN